jgi:UDP-glucose 4-epimerase
MARILITGGAGYVGSHCAKALAAAGHQGVVFDNLVFGHREFVRWGPLIEGDIRNAAALDAVFSSHRFDAVISLRSPMWGNRSPHQADIMTPT